MKLVLATALLALAVAAPAAAGTAWIVTYPAVGDQSVFYSDGAYVIMPTGQVYLHQDYWIYQGPYGEVVFPAGFPSLTLLPGYNAAIVPVAVADPEPVACQPPTRREIRLRR